MIARALCLAVALWSAVAHAKGERIFQAFDERFVAIEGRLDALKALGFTAVQVSPPQKSPADTVWYARYQPIDFQVIDGPLGNETELQHLVTLAHAKGLKVLADVVFNHMADPKHVGGHLRYPEFSEADFHYNDGQHCMADFSDRHQVTTYWLCDSNAHLPDLDTSSGYVRSVHKKYLKKLLGLGIDGFRFDAVKHVEPEYWADVLQVVPQSAYYYGEVIGESLWESHLYTDLMPVTDFHLLRTMLSAFSANGDLRFLTDPEAFGAALPGNVAVVFARNHDTAMHADFFNFGDYQDALLANAYVIGRGVGDVLVYRDDADKVLTRAALAFDRSLKNDGPFVRKAEDICGSACDGRTTLFLERGGKGIMILNAANAWMDVQGAKMPGLEEGCYREVLGGVAMTVTKGSDGQRWVSAWGSAGRGGLRIGPRTALFLVKSGNDSCF